MAAAANTATKITKSSITIYAINEVYTPPRFCLEKRVMSGNIIAPIITPPTMAATPSSRESTADFSKLIKSTSGILSSAPKSIIAVTAAKIGIMIEASTLMALNPYSVVMSMAQPATISMGHSGIIILNSALSKRTTALENKSIFTPNQPINDKAKAILTMPAPALPNAIFTNK